ncbi:UPF0103-domain-containing protein [Coprinopsis marcescibilis]|uniref:UPF0103-domain-containing protein n=1 Tax=Coprinopsis marcescibilis TaxID=230819 RepID=A0A5C3LBN8_COPMA|nr:UPF0103-domain-containing protein [Coprinopsis marcescibilis]
MAVRSASHAGSWYNGDGKILDQELERWLGDVAPVGESFPITGCKAVIAPHAGYSYSGPAAGWAYKAIDPTGIRRVFILGPSHHFYLNGCALSSCKEYETPIGTLPLDTETIKELKETGKFTNLSLQADEDEHSLEMHLPYIRKVFEGKNITIVPIVVGAIDRKSEVEYGALLAPYLAQEGTLCVVSSDFCHWGTRFSYTYYCPDAETPIAAGISLSRTSPPSSSYPIYQSIQRLDRQAMDILSIPPGTAKDAHQSFDSYLQETRNTICGRHPIGVLFGALSALREGSDPKVKWVRYEQSSQCHNIRDSSVSYASAYVTF